jgi:hypothetical protein
MPLRWLTNLSERRKVLMELSCDQKCRVEEMLANLKCPGCFQAKAQPSEKESEENGGSATCQCMFEFDPELLRRWD